MLNQSDAFKILGINAGSVTPEEIKQAFRKAAQKFHPDRNPAGLEMMKLINLAYDTVRDFSGNVEQENQDFGDKLNEALNAVINLGLNIELCGCWIWVSGDTKTHKEALKEAGYKWAPKKLCWYFRAEDQKRRTFSNWSLDKIREVHGSKIMRSSQLHLA